VIVAPPLAITASGEHQGFAGTLSIGSAALEMVLIELVRSAQWSARVIFVNGHGGNSAAVTAAVDALNKEGRPVLSWWPRVRDGDAHAGRTETSLMMAIAPESVRVDAIEPGCIEPLRTLMPTLRAKGLAAVSPNGVLGDPRGANATEGADVLATLVADAVMCVNAWIDQ
jgi:creatinine amidohydrolase